jgi:hypothetical protein
MTAHDPQVLCMLQQQSNELMRKRNAGSAFALPAMTYFAFCIAAFATALLFAVVYSP